jgi:hypothetical protein
MPGRVAPPGVSRPFSDIGGEIRMTRAYQARHRPSSGFFAPSTVCSLSDLADTLGPLPLMGFSLGRSFEQEGRDALLHPLHPLIHSA